jgi:TonB family protein
MSDKLSHITNLPYDEQAAQTNMKLISLLAPLAAHSQAAAQTPAAAQSPQGGEAPRYARVNPIFSPMAPYPEEALKKGIEGTVLVAIDVDSKGLVTNVLPVSGPPELFQAAIDSAKQWRFNPPENPPIRVQYEITYNHPYECPGPISTHGAITTGGPLETANGLKFSSEDIDLGYLLWYFHTKVRKTGVAGEMILSITADTDGRVKKVRIVKSLSPELDKVALESARKWKFKLIKGNKNSRPGDFEFPVTFSAECDPD